MVQENTVINHKEHRGIIGAYVIRHVATGKLYIGSTRDVYFRIKRHFNDLAKGNSSNKALQEAFDKEPFLTTSVYETNTREEAYKIEQELIDYLINSDILFNIATDVKASNKGKTMSPEHKEMFRRLNTGRPMSLEHKAKLLKINLGKKLTDEQKEEIGLRRRGKKRPLEELRNFMESRRENGQPVEIDGIKYRSIPEASESLNITYHQVYHRCHSKPNGFPNWNLISKEQTFSTSI